MIQLQRAEYDTLPPVTENERVPIDGVLSVAFHNAGTTTVKVNGFWTILPGSNFQLSVPVPHVVIATQLIIMFEGVGINRLEMSTLRIVGEEYSNFSEKSLR